MKILLSKPGDRGSAISVEAVAPGPTPALADQKPKLKLASSRKPARKPTLAERLAAAEAERERRASPAAQVADEDAQDKRVWADQTQPIESRLEARLRLLRRRHSGLIRD